MSRLTCLSSSINKRAAGNNTPLRGQKGDVYEGGTRVPTVVAWPGQTTPRKIETPVQIVDWMPTFCKLAGVNSDDSGPGRFPVDGLDVWPIITGASTISSHHEIVLGYD